jgi:hypothetical protein
VCVVLKQTARFSERAVARRAVEQALADLVLDAANRLADSGLSAVQPAGGRREASIRRHRDESGQVWQLHKYA